MTSSAAFHPLLRAHVSRVRADERSRYFRQLHGLLQAGVGISYALSSLGEQKSSPALRRAASHMSSLVAAGGSWSAAMQHYPALFSEMTVAVIAAGEAGGFLSQACLILAGNAERDYHIHKAIQREATYPKLLLFLSTLVIPLPLNIGFGLTLEPLVQIEIILGVWGGWKAINWLWPVGVRSAVRFQIDEKRLKIPLAGKVIRALAVAKFCRFLGMSYAAGVSLPRGVSLAAAACGNLALADKLASVVPALERGQSLSSVLMATGELPQTALPMLQSGELSGDLEPQLQTAARFLDSDAETAMRQTIIALGILIFLLVAAKIGAQVVQAHMKIAGV